MSILESFIYGLFSGASDFMPVSMAAHQSLMLRIFGIDQRIPLYDMFVHIAIIAALFTACSSSVYRIKRELALSARSSRYRNHDSKGQYELRLLKTATLPMLIGMCLWFATHKLEGKLVYIAIFWALNGVILFLPDLFRQGNKDARSMSGLDAILIGLAGIVAVFPGISRVGTMLSVCSVRGADRQQSLSWALLLSIPAVILLCLFDIITMFSLGLGIASFLGFLGCLLAAIGAFCGAYLAISIMRYLTVRAGFSGFAYYSWGAALFAFILYLIT